MYFDFNAVNIEQTTYSEILDYNAKINANRTNGNIVGGTQILSDNETSLQATDINITINEITQSTINFSFSFTRNDGKIITGNYSGNYLTP